MAKAKSKAQAAATAPAKVSRKSNGRSLEFMGYRRENGRVGVRNHVIVLPLDDLSNAACEAVANNIKGTLALPHPYGRLQFAEDLELHFRTLIGTGATPDVPAAHLVARTPGATGRRYGACQLCRQQTDQRQVSRRLARL